MAVEIKVPDMGESVIEATVARWMKQEGEPVKAGEPVVELETDKINLEVGAQQAGVLQKIVRQAGETVAVGDVLAMVAGQGEPAATPATQVPIPTTASTPPRPVAPAAPVDLSVDESADRSAGDTNGQAAATAGAAPVSATPVALRMAQELGIDLNKVIPSGPGGRITKEDVQAFANSAKAPPPKEGFLRTPEEQAVSRDAAAKAAEAQAAGQKEVAADLSAQAQAAVTPSVPAQPAPAAPPPAPAAPPQPGGVPYQGTAEPIPADRAAPRTPGEQPQPSPLPTAQTVGLETRMRLSRRRQTIARRLVEAQHTAAMLTTFNEIDMSAVMELRKRRRESFKERYGVDLGYMSFFVKASIAALKAFPNVNAELQGDELILKQHYDIGVAIGAEEGLVVPVIRDADRLNFAGIEKAIKDFVSKVKDGTLAIEDLRGGTFTITNGGVYGSLMSTPILNPPQVGILGMHAIKERPVVVNGAIIARPMMYVALSYDHRVVDGREAVQFLVRIKELIEDPETLMFG